MTTATPTPSVSTAAKVRIRRHVVDAACMTMVVRVVDNLREDDRVEALAAQGDLFRVKGALLAAARAGPWMRCWSYDRTPVALAYVADFKEEDGALQMGLVATDQWPLVSKAVMRDVMGEIMPMLAQRYPGRRYYAHALQGHGDGHRFLTDVIGAAHVGDVVDQRDPNRIWRRYEVVLIPSDAAEAA